jgi:hypothetical protein
MFGSLSKKYVESASPLQGNETEIARQLPDGCAGLYQGLMRAAAAPAKTNTFV